MIDLIYSSAGNDTFARAALSAGWLAGGRLPATVYHRLDFADNEYQRPNRTAYVDAIAKHKPKLATVIDWQNGVEFGEVMAWAEDVAPHVETIIIIPKLHGTISRIPSIVGGKPVRLGYSVPTSNGGTCVAFAEFGDRQVHLLGGNPVQQLRLTKLLNVVSADTNYHQSMATKRCQFFSEKEVEKAKNKHWPTLAEVDLFQHKSAIWKYSAETNAPLFAFTLSCINIMSMWKNHQNLNEFPLFQRLCAERGA